MRVDKNEKTLRDLITYKPGAVAYGLLINIKNREDVAYDEKDEDKKRCLNLLLDDGYLKPAPGIHYVQFCSGGIVFGLFADLFEKFRAAFVIEVLAGDRFLAGR